MPASTLQFDMAPYYDDYTNYQTNVSTRGVYGRGSRGPKYHAP